MSSNNITIENLLTAWIDSRVNDWDGSITPLVSAFIEALKTNEDTSFCYKALAHEFLLQCIEKKILIPRVPFAYMDDEKDPEHIFGIKPNADVEDGTLFINFNGDLGAIDLPSGEKLVMTVSLEPNYEEES